jgi:hypothetical protein
MQRMPDRMPDCHQLPPAAATKASSALPQSADELTVPCTRAAPQDQTAAQLAPAGSGPERISFQQYLVLAFPGASNDALDKLQAWSLEEASGQVSSLCGPGPGYMRYCHACAWAVSITCRASYICTCMLCTCCYRLLACHAQRAPLPRGMR